MLCPSGAVAGSSEVDDRSNVLFKRQEGNFSHPDKVIRGKVRCDSETLSTSAVLRGSFCSIVSKLSQLNAVRGLPKREKAPTARSPIACANPAERDHLSAR